MLLLHQSVNAVIGHRFKDKRFEISLKYLFFKLNLSSQVKRQAFGFGPAAYSLPDGSEFIVGQVRSTFTCQNRIYGYYADQDNNCQIFHICNPVILADGTLQTQMYSFFCGNQTVFDQSKLACVHFEDAVPCSQAHNYLGVNELFFRTERPPAFLRG